MALAVSVVSVASRSNYNVYTTGSVPLCIHELYGSPTSQHLLGLAADFRPNYTNTGQMSDRMAKIRQWFKDKLEARAYTLQLGQDWVGEEWDQLIDYGKFFHVGVRPEGSTNRFQTMKWNGFGQGYQKD